MTDDFNEGNNFRYSEKQPALTPTLDEQGQHSKSSVLSGHIRYSKMPEEQAATIFEQRYLVEIKRVF